MLWGFHFCFCSNHSLFALFFQLSDCQASLVPFFHQTVIPWGCWRWRGEGRSPRPFRAPLQRSPPPPLPWLHPPDRLHQPLPRRVPAEILLRVTRCLTARQARGQRDRGDEPWGPGTGPRRCGGCGSCCPSAAVGGEEFCRKYTDGSRRLSPKVNESIVLVGQNTD